MKEVNICFEQTLTIIINNNIVCFLVKSRSGFEKLPESDVAAAVRKSKAEKNKICLKIAAIVGIVSSLVACLTAFLLTRESNFIPIEFSRNMSANTDIQHMKEVEMVAQAAERFSKTLYAVIKEEDKGNILFSPYSVAAVLAMLSEGAGGKTLEMMRSRMFLPDSDSLRRGYRDSVPALRTNDNFTLDTANTGFVMKRFQLLEEFKTILHENYHAGMTELDFADNEKAARMINDWVMTMTRDRIKDLIPADSLNAMTRLVLVNAIYFKADWQSKFDKVKTVDSPFWVSEEESKQVQMMRLTKEISFANLDELDCSVVELPYKGERIVMQILLPNKKTGVYELEDKLASSDLQSLFIEGQFKVKVDVSLPRFKLSHSLPLSDSLQEMGMGNMFSPAADLSGIDGTRNLFVSKVLQKVFVEVNEEGSEAAAATGVIVMMRSMPPRKQTFNVDHPFIFMIRDTLTGMLLFQGRVVDPSINTE